MNLSAPMHSAPVEEETVAKKTPYRRAGWYQDEGSPSHLRWWDGIQWTANVKRVPERGLADVRSTGQHPPPR
jgi:hypothetical protein